jgi:hypothetical protein
MTIETRYNIGDRVWFMHDNKVESEIIIKINAVIEKDMNRTGVYKSIAYSLFNYCRYYTEDKLFPTKEELIKSL